MMLRTLLRQLHHDQTGVLCCEAWQSVSAFHSSSVINRRVISSNGTKPPRPTKQQKPETVTVLSESYTTDDWTNITPRILSKLSKNLHNKQQHPLGLIRQRIQNYFYSAFVNRFGNPLFAVFDQISPVVTTYQNFESLLIPRDHPSWSRSDTYFINEEKLLRCHTSAHQEELIRMGFDAFLCIGDVYRRDEIDSTHYPVFHQVEGVRLFSHHDLFEKLHSVPDLDMFEDGKRLMDKQACHTVDTVKLVEYNLKSSLLGLAHKLFGKDVETRWVDCYFPFTHPSWELEVKYQDKWLEVLGCGIMEQELLNTAGVSSKVGWAFGLGLERLAMKLYGIPDIRLFWSEDPGFLHQFEVKDPETNINYKPVSQFPPCMNDISFWVPPSFVANDFYDLVRNIGADLIEQVSLVDEFTHPKSKRKSHCYRIVYRHMEKTLTQAEANAVHEKIEQEATSQLNIEIR